MIDAELKNNNYIVHDDYYSIIDKYKRLNVCFWLLIIIASAYNITFTTLTLIDYFNHVNMSLLYGLLVCILPVYPLGWIAYWIKAKSNNVRDDIIMRYSNKTHLVRSYKTICWDNFFIFALCLLPPAVYLLYLFAYWIVHGFNCLINPINHKLHEINTNEDYNQTINNAMIWKEAHKNSKSHNTTALRIDKYNKRLAQLEVRHPHKQ